MRFPGERVEIDVMNMMQDIAQIVVEKSEGMPYDEFAEYVMGALSIDLGFDEAFYAKAGDKAVAEKLLENMLETYRRRMDTIVQRTLPVIKDICEKNAAMPDDAVLDSCFRRQEGISGNAQYKEDLGF